MRVLASEILTKHALVSSVHFTDSGVWFKLNNGERGRITGIGKLYYGYPESHDEDWVDYSSKSVSLKAALAKTEWKPTGGDLDDEIPF